MENIKKNLANQVEKIEKSIKNIRSDKITSNLEGNYQAYRVALDYIILFEDKKEFKNKLIEIEKDYKQVLNCAIKSKNANYIRFINNFLISINKIITNL